MLMSRASRRTFQHDFAWQRQFLPEIKRRCVDLFVHEAPPEEDIHHNTDLLVLKIDTVRIACRIRTHQYLERWPDEITIRAKRHGTDTELDKIVAGWGDYFFYGFAGQGDRPPLSRWSILCLSHFRQWVHHTLEAQQTMPGILQQNRDGSSQFLAFNVFAFPPGIIYDGHGKKR